MRGLIADLREVADEATARVNLAVQKAEIIVSKLDESIPIESILAQVDRSEQPRAAEVESLNRVPQVDISSIEDPTLRIYHLADQGHSADDIAAREGRSPGEVRLILDLRKLKMEARPPDVRQQWFCGAARTASGLLGEMKDCPENSTVLKCAPPALFRGQAAFLRGAVPDFTKSCPLTFQNALHWEYGGNNLPGARLSRIGLTDLRGTLQPSHLYEQMDDLQGPEWSLQ